MRLPQSLRFFVGSFSALAVLTGSQACRVQDEIPEPISYTMRFPAPETQMAEIDLVAPTEGREEIQLLMPRWSPGYYRIQDYASKIQEISART